MRIHLKRRPNERDDLPPIMWLETEDGQIVENVEICAVHAMARVWTGCVSMELGVRVHVPTEPAGQAFSATYSRYLSGRPN